MNVSCICAAATATVKVVVVAVVAATTAAASAAPLNGEVFQEEKAASYLGSMTGFWWVGTMILNS